MRHKNRSSGRRGRPARAFLAAVAIGLYFLLGVGFPLHARIEHKPGFNTFSPQQDIELGREAVQEVERKKGDVPHHLPGKNPFLTEFPARHGLPEAAARGGAETMYPEFRIKMKGMPPAQAGKR